MHASMHWLLCWLQVDESQLPLGAAMHAGLALRYLELKAEEQQSEAGTSAAGGAGAGAGGSCGGGDRVEGATASLKEAGSGGGMCSAA